MTDTVELRLAWHAKNDYKPNRLHAISYLLRNLNALCNMQLMWANGFSIFHKILTFLGSEMTLGWLYKFEYVPGKRKGENVNSITSVLRSNKCSALCYHSSNKHILNVLRMDSQSHFSLGGSTSTSIMSSDSESDPEATSASSAGCTTSFIVLKAIIIVKLVF